MSVFEKFTAATESGDIAALSDLLSEDFTFVRHQSGTSMNKAETVAMLGKMFKNGFAEGARRKIYENDDILVTHAFNDYPDGSREAVLSAWSLRNGKITRLETGATLV